jgi:hypothetical protein
MVGEVWPFVWGGVEVEVVAVVGSWVPTFTKDIFRLARNCELGQGGGGGR